MLRSEVPAPAVIGADGRNSTVRRQSGITLERHEATHMIAGVLVEGLADVDIQHDWLATSDDLSWPVSASTRARCVCTW